MRNVQIAIQMRGLTFLEIYTNDILPHFRKPMQISLTPMSVIQIEFDDITYRLLVSICKSRFFLRSARFSLHRPHLPCIQYISMKSMGWLGSCCAFSAIRSGFLDTATPSLRGNPQNSNANDNVIRKGGRFSFLSLIVIILGIPGQLGIISI